MTSRPKLKRKERMTTDLKQALAVKAPTKTDTILALIERQRPAIERALPQAATRNDPDRFLRLVKTELRRNPALYECEPNSLLGAMMLSAQLGLEPGPLGHAYLVPFKKVVTFIVGYKGYIHLANKSGLLKEIVARPVYEGDGFSYKFTDAGDRFLHEPCSPADRGAAVKFYGRARTRTGGSIVHVMYPEEIEARAKRSPAYKSGTGPWVTDRIAMSQKTVIRAMAPWLPQSAEWGRAVYLDDTQPRWDDSELVAEPVFEIEGGDDENS